MKDEPLAIWSENFRLRLHLLQFSGGFRSLFISQFLGSGLPVTFFTLVVWLVKLSAGETVTSVQRLLVILLAESSAIAVFISLLYLVAPKVQIGTSRFQVGGLSWKNDAFESVSWMTHVVGGVERQILVLTTKKARRVAVTIPVDRSKQQVDELLLQSGIKR